MTLFSDFKNDLFSFMEYFLPKSDFNEPFSKVWVFENLDGDLFGDFLGDLDLLRGVILGLLISSSS